MTSGEGINYELPHCSGFSSLLSFSQPQIYTFNSACLFSLVEMKGKIIGWEMF